MRKFFFAAAVAVAALLSNVSSADAAFKVRVSTNGGGSFTTVTDNLAGDFNALSGNIGFSYTDAVASFTIVGGVSKPDGGNGPTLSLIDISLLGTVKTTVAAGTIIVDITDTDFNAPTSPVGGGILTTKFTGGAISGSLTSLQLTGWANGATSGSPGTGNIEFAGTGVPLTGFLATAGPSTGAAVSTIVAPPNLVGPYSLTGRFSFGGTAGSGFSMDGNVTYTNPAPAGLVLALVGAPFMALGARIRRRRAVTA